MNHGLWGGCEDNCVAVRVGCIGVRRGRGHVRGSEWDVRRVTGEHGGTIIGGRRGVQGEWTIGGVDIATRGGTGRRDIAV